MPPGASEVGAAVGASEVGVSCTYSIESEPDHVGSAVGGSAVACAGISVGSSWAIWVDCAVGISVGCSVAGAGVAAASVVSGAAVGCAVGVATSSSSCVWATFESVGCGIVTSAQEGGRVGA